MSATRLPIKDQLLKAFGRVNVNKLEEFPSSMVMVIPCIACPMRKLSYHFPRFNDPAVLECLTCKIRWVPHNPLLDAYASAMYMHLIYGGYE